MSEELDAEHEALNLSPVQWQTMYENLLCDLENALAMLRDVTEERDALLVERDG